jgi:hypothetical protein
MIKQVFFVLASMLLAASMWIWVQDITIARQQKEAAERGIPRGNLSDLYPRWLGARELLLRGRDPYGEDITREIQTGYYGRPIDANRPNDPKDQQAFAYPLYVVFVLAPSVLLPFHMVQRGFFWLLITLTGLSVLLWFHVMRWRVSLTTRLAWIVLVLGCFPALQAFKLQQLTLLVAAFLAASITAIVEGQLVLAGILLAIATVKPQLVALTAIWLVIWTLGNWRQRQRLLWSCVGAMACLLIGSEVLLPGWLGKFRTATAAYYQYTGGGLSLLDMGLTTIGGRLAAICLVAMLIVFLWQVRRESERSMAFQWSLAVVLATTLVTIPMFAPYNQVLLVPCLMLLVKEIHRVWQAGRLSRFFIIITTASVVWPWIAAAALAIALLVFPLSTVERAWWLPLTTTLMIPIALLALIFVMRNTILSGTPE